MKKFILAFVVIAVLGTAGFLGVKEYGKHHTPEPQTTTSVTAGTTTTTTTTAATTTTTTTTTTTAKVPETDTPAFVTFKGTINSINGKTIMVAPEFGTREASAGTISVDCSSVPLTDANGKTVRADDIENFSSVSVTYNGEMRETYPPQITATKITLTDRIACNVYFYFDGEMIAIRKLAVGAPLDAADMPNAGAYCEDGYHFECWLNGNTPVTSMAKVTDSIVLNAKISKD